MLTAKVREGNLVASRKLGIFVLGKRSRLIGDGTISGACPCSKIQEIRFPGLRNGQMSAKRFGP